MPPAVWTVEESFWSQMLSPMAYTASILALILGLSQHLPPLWRLSAAWSDWVARLILILGLGWPESSAQPGRLATFCRAAQEVVWDTLSAMTAYGAQL